MSMATGHEEKGRDMKIAVASGKGGTGKTTLAVSLALAASRMGPASYVDCDVEEPNGWIFLKPEITAETRVSVPVPRVNEELCNGCGVCGEVCQYGAIAPVGKRSLVFEEMCHGCGGCALFCPTGAITEIGREIGTVTNGLAAVTFGSVRRRATAGGFRGGIDSAVGSHRLEFVEGRIDIGVGSVPPVVRAARKAAPELMTSVVVDCPPGTACSMVAAARGCDIALLVTEPTPFGLHDLTLAVELLERMAMPIVVVVNRSDIGDRGVRTFCESRGIKIVLEIPFSRHIASVCSKGGTLLDAVPALVPTFESLLVQMIEWSRQ